MQQETSSTSVLPVQSRRESGSRLPHLSLRARMALVVCGLLALLAIVPPLLSLNRYQRRVTASISEVLGRPVHLDRVTLNLLPLPSFTLENLVIDEAPDFGAEPMIRANAVTARLRLGSLWRHRVEFSRITFADPSVNLVHLPDGRWNLAGILLQASHVDAAPTTQETAGDAPRFPYIEATNARINLKLGQEKTPFALTEADFALWLPQPRQWRMRIGAKPARTDTNVSDTGTVQIEASLERAAAIGEVPLSADLTWTDAPMGATSRLLTGGDAGVRGQLNLSAHLRGHLASAPLQLRAQIDGLRRSDFVPEHAVFLDLDCSALATRIFHSFEDVRCSWPVPDGKGAAIAMTGSIGDVLHLARSSQLEIGTSDLPASVLSAWAHVLSAHIPADTRASGSVSATLAYPGGEQGAWEGRAAFEQLEVAGGALDAFPVDIGTASLQMGSSAGRPVLQLAPVELSLGGRDPATLEGTADREGYSLHLAGMIAIPRLLALAAAAPQFGEGLPAVLPKNRAAGPTRLDFTAHRNWGEAQIWTNTQTHPPAPAVHGPAPARPAHRR